MKNNLHTTENWLPGDADHVRLRRARGSTRQTLLFVVLSCFLSTALPAQPQASADTGPASATPAPRHLDRSGKSRKGKASYYGREFYKKEMADGTPMNPQSNAAASKTLPLGTKARVTNLKNGNSEVVEIRDRGPYVKDRIVDLSPKTADKLGLKKDGVVPVEVKPVEVPQADGTVKPGAGVQESERGRSSVDVQDSHSLH
jgi:rare lipoprotein A